MESVRQSNFRALTSAEVALETIMDVFAVHPDCGTIALIENRRDQHGVAMPVEGPDPGPEHLQKLDELLLKAVGDEHDCRLVFASIRSGEGRAVQEDDLEHWRRLQDRHRGRACRLVDWFVIGTGDRRALSLAETHGPSPEW